MAELFRLGLNNAAWATGLALVAAVGSRVFRRRPALVHTLWLLVLLKLITPSVLDVSPPWPEPAIKQRSIDASFGSSVSAVSSEPESLRSSSSGKFVPEAEKASSGSLNTNSAAGRSVNHARLPAQSWPWRSLIALAWMAGAVVWWGFVGLSIVRFRKLRRLSVRAPEELQDRIKQIAIAIGLGERATPFAAIAPARISPLVWVWPLCRPRLVLPQELWGRLDESQQNAVLAHELAHLKRGDHWVRWLEAVVLGLYWWDPVAWWARREIERAEEESCDAWVVWSQPGAASAFAEALLATTAFLSGVNRPLPLGASGVGSTSAIKRRLEMILSDVTNSSLVRSGSIVSLFLAAACLPLLPAIAAGKSQQASRGVALEPAQVTGAKSKKEPDSAPAPSRGGPMPADRVCVVRPVVRRLGDYLDVEATRLQPASQIDVGAQVGGMLQKVGCKPGQRVRKGQVLFELDARSFGLELQKADAEVKRQESRMQGSLEKSRKAMGPERAGALLDLGEAEATLLVLKADRLLVKLKLDWTKVLAPSDGLIRRVMVREGSFVEPGKTTLATIVSDDLLAADLYIEESTARRLDHAGRERETRSGSAVRIGVRDEEGFPHPGTIDFVDPEIQGTDQVRVRILVPNPDGSLNPGLSARVQVQAGPAHDSVLVTDSTIAEQDGRRFVQVLTDDNVVARRFIQIGERFGDLRVIERGLTANDWLIEGTARYTLGSKISEKDIVRPLAPPGNTAKPPTE